MEEEARLFKCKVLGKPASNLFERSAAHIRAALRSLLISLRLWLFWDYFTPCRCGDHSCHCSLTVKERSDNSFVRRCFIQNEQYLLRLLLRSAASKRGSAENLSPMASRSNTCLAHRRLSHTAVREIGNRDKKFGKNGARPRRPQGTASPTNLKI